MICAKIAFSSKDSVKKARKKIPGAAGMRLYACPKCGQWHMTSMRLSSQPRRAA